MGVFRWSGPICCKGGDNTYYIGIDVHKKKCVSTIKEKTSKILWQTEFDNNVPGITGFIKMIRKEGYVPATAVCESTANYWIVVHDMLEDAGIDTMLAHPHNTKIITETVYKNDKADSEKLADLCRLDMIPESFVADKPARDLRELTRTRLGIKMYATGPKNRIHAILAKYPHEQPKGGLFTGPGLEWLQAVPLREVDRMAVQSHLATIDTLLRQVAKFEKKIAGIAMSDRRAQLIMTIPGIGYITAVTILAEIVDHGRFADAEKLASYAGLVPKHHNSGETTRTGGITKRGSVWLRRAMVEAAFVAVRHDARIGARYQRLATRIGPMKARVAVARQMLEWVWEMLDHDAEYRTQDKELVKRKLQKIKRIAESRV